jgi:hypothetical protein
MLLGVLCNAPASRGSLRLSLCASSCRQFSSSAQAMSKAVCSAAVPLPSCSASASSREVSPPCTSTVSTIVPATRKVNRSRSRGSMSSDPSTMSTSVREKAPRRPLCPSTTAWRQLVPYVPRRSRGCDQECMYITQAYKMGTRQCDYNCSATYVTANA